ncbi:hypothetical protein CHU98_g3607 [Xylaria longipes]|nr:hypothetical protein CHU98_g3607 [Xylaria longipes]
MYVVSNRDVEALAPPQDAMYESWAECVADIQKHASTRGYALRTKIKTKNKKREITRYEILCDKGGKFVSRASVGGRAESSKKTNCPFSAVAKLKNNTWCFEVAEGRHNHPPSSSPRDHIQHRAKTEIHREIMKQGVDHQRNDRQILQDLRTADPGCLLTLKDVNNHVAAQRRNAKKVPGEASQVLVMLRDTPDIWHVPLITQGVLSGLFWAPIWSQQMWQRHADVLVMDSTHRVNKYNMPLLQINGVTEVGTYFGAAYAMIPDEKGETMQWVMGCVERLRHKLQIPRPPYTITTDFSSAEKLGISSVWGDHTQQQLCIWHIMKNVRLNTKKNWKGKLPDKYRPVSIETLLSYSGVVRASQFMAEETAVALDSEPREACVVDEERYTAAEIERIERRYYEEKPTIDHSLDGLLTLWRCIAHTPCRKKLQEHWEDLKTEFPEQGAIIKYLGDTYMEYREQWCQAYTKGYRNFGVRSSSRVESSHNEVQTRLQRTDVDMATLVKTISQLSEDKATVYREKVGKQQQRTRAEMFNKTMFADKSLQFSVSWVALEEARQQYLIALRHHQSGKAVDLNDCTGDYINQKGIPCWHVLYSRMKLETRGPRNTKYVMIAKGRELKKEHFDVHWWLLTDIQDVDPLYLVRDPAPRPRHHLARNSRCRAEAYINNGRVREQSNWIQNGGRRIPCHEEIQLQEGGAVHQPVTVQEATATLARQAVELAANTTVRHREMGEIREAVSDIVASQPVASTPRLRSQEVPPTPTGPYRRLAMASPSPLVGMPPPVTMAMTSPSPLVGMPPPPRPVYTTPSPLVPYPVVPRPWQHHVYSAEYALGHQQGPQGRYLG